MSSSPLFRRKPTPPSPSPSPKAQAQAQQSTSPKSSGKRSLFPPLPSSSPSSPSPSPKNSYRRAPDISLPSAITSATHIATTPLLPSGTLHNYNGNNNPGESSSSSSPSTPATATAAVAASASASATVAAREVPDAPMFRAKPSSSSSGSGGGGNGGAHERMWAEMQQKLQEVELSADHVFGSSHAKCLEELRAAQIALAQAWMRSEEEEGGGGLDGEHVEFGREAFGRDAGKGKGVAGATAGGGEGRDVLETEGDILLARKRRLANDEHFTRVAQSVQDVTSRLEAVAEAMASVEMESRGIWAGGTESNGTSIR